MRRCAKNASTTTIRIGNAALLKNLLIASLYTDLYAPGDVSSQMHPRVKRQRSSGVFALLAVFPSQNRDVRQVAVALGVVHAVADREAVRDLEAHVADRQVDLAPAGLREEGAYLQRRRPPRPQHAELV